jgi:hypothetical protein
LQVQRIIPCLEDLTPDVLDGEGQVDMKPILRLMRLIAELSELLSIDFVTMDHLNMADLLVREVSNLLPVYYYYSPLFTPGSH